MIKNRSNKEIPIKCTDFTLPFTTSVSPKNNRGDDGSRNNHGSHDSHGDDNRGSNDRRSKGHGDNINQAYHYQPSYSSYCRHNHLVGQCHN